MLFGSLLTILTPFYAQLGPGILIFLRFPMGLLLGSMWPCLYALWPQWVVANERGRRIGFSFSSIQFGFFAALALSKSLCIQGYGNINNIGASFYISGLLGLIWCFFWILYVYDSPDEHKIMYKSEKIKLLKENFHLMRKKIQKRYVSTKIPWKEIFSSKCLISIFVAHFCLSFVQYLIVIYIDAYLENILNIDIIQVN
jgi:sugar phosphate permease